jgi:hypothetical protein
MHEPHSIAAAGHLGISKSISILVQSLHFGSSRELQSPHAVAESVFAGGGDGNKGGRFQNR